MVSALFHSSSSSPSLSSTLTACLPTGKSLQTHPTALALAAVLASHGLRKGSLSRSGAVAALIVGYLTLANPFPGFGTILIVFYLAGSRVTKVKAAVKATLEREESDIARQPKERQKVGSDPSQSHKSSSGGQRDAWQVLSNAFTGCMGALVFRVIHSGELPDGCWQRFVTGSSGSSAMLWHIIHRMLELFSLSSSTTVSWQAGVAICALNPDSATGWTRAAVMIVLGHFACCTGDVFASELGILSSSPPRLLTAPWRIVPPGTNGGISPWGTIASALGGLLIGLVLYFCLLIFNQACLPMLTSTPWHVLYLLVLATAAGFTGSMIDSFLGAVTQRTWYNTTTKQVLVGRLPAFLAHRQDSGTTTEWQVITGRDLLSNGQVNFLSSAITAFALAIADRFLSPIFTPS